MERTELINKLDGLVDSNELARRFGVTRLTTINWRKKGCPHEVVELTNSLGTAYCRVYFDLDAVGEWEEDYRGSLVHRPKKGKRKL